MKAFPIAVMIALSSAFLSTSAIAQNKPLACQEDAGAGLLWENGRWITKTFVTENKFILAETPDGLATNSVAKALSHEFTNQISCKKTTLNHISCIDISGGSFFFDPKTFKGGVSQIYGSTSNGNKRDTVSVVTFSCTAF